MLLVTFTYWADVIGHIHILSRCYCGRSKMLVEIIELEACVATQSWVNREACVATAVMGEQDGGWARTLVGPRCRGSAKWRCCFFTTWVSLGPSYTGRGSDHMVLNAELNQWTAFLHRYSSCPDGIGQCTVRWRLHRLWIYWGGKQIEVGLVCQVR